MEKWKDVVGYSGFYQVSNLGNVRRVSCRNNRSTIKLTKGSNGYYVVNLSKENKQKTRTVHQLVAEAFLNHKPCGYAEVVDHIDNNKLNNTINNLQLISQKENTIKSMKKKPTGVTWNKGRNKWQAQVREGKRTKYLGIFQEKKDALAEVKKYYSLKT
jgi:hypothetical protein